jgi:phospholipid/cholesterol/gamma-HCH transport system substrate-binding protein
MIVRNTNLTVGLFVSVALAIFVVVTIWLSGRHGSEPTTNYSMFFYKDVSGLMLGGPVFYLGVEVGNVTRMEIIPGDPMSVRIDIEVLESTPIDTGTSASLAFQGITGVAVINLVGDPGMNLPLKTPPGLDYPVIEVRDSGLAALLSGAPRIIDKINALLDKAGRLIGGDNQSLVTGTLQNIESITRALQTKEESFASLPDSLSSTLNEVQQTLSELQDATRDARPGLAATMQNIEQMSERLASLTGRLDAWAGENSSDMNEFLNNGLGQVPELVSDARDALREMEKLLREIRDDPSSLLYRTADDAVKTEE